MNDRRFFLRGATASAHRQLDNALGQIKSPADYARYVHALTVFRAAVEPELAKELPLQSAFASTQLCPALWADCSDLGLKDVRPLTSEIELDAAARFGVTYVLEGSALGAPLLQASARQLGFNDDFGARHLAQQIAARSNWQAFAVLLEQEPDLDMDRVSSAAIATFNLALKAAQEAGHVTTG
jgi:heme oxygenase (biliverdin-IX-beta and delta-forming)